MNSSLSSLPLYQISRIVYRNWKNIYFGAVPYLNAMASLESIDDNFGYDTGKSIVLYFLSNAQSWRGDIARAVKQELKQRLK